MNQLNFNLERRKYFNEYMREEVYGDEIQENFDMFNTKKATIWIDPLDGTRQVTQGILSNVTILIGLSINGLPKLGVIHNPFRTNCCSSNGVTLFGS